MVDQEAVRRQVAAGLRRARQRASLTQAELALALALSTSAVRHFEAARHSIRIEQLPALAYALGCTVRELLIHMRLVREARERRTPGPSARDGTGQSDDGSALGERSTASDPHGDASHAEHSAEQMPPA